MIFFDPMLCQVARVVTVGALQIVLAMLEANAVDPALLLDAPVDALASWGHDPTLGARAHLASGREVTILELQRLFLDRAARFVSRRGCEGYVPRADEIVSLWSDLLDALERRDVDYLSSRLDWALKHRLLDGARRRHRGLTWQSPAMKVLDHLFASLDDDGLFVSHDRQDRLTRVVSEDEIRRAMNEPPEDTRAWGRTFLLRRFGDRVVDLDWHWIEIALVEQGWPTRRRVLLDDPLGFTRASMLERSGAVDPGPVIHTEGSVP